MYLVADEVTFGYPGHPVLDQVSFRVNEGTRLGVVGENGTGKSTLIAILAGVLTPTLGEVRRQGTVNVVEQEMRPSNDETVGDLIHDTLTDLRDIAAELDAIAQTFDHDHGNLAELTAALERAEHLAVWDADRRVDEALTRLGACRDPKRRLITLSVGERYRVRLACRLAERTDLLLLDEPTNHLDAGGIDYLTGELIAWRGGVVMVTHDRQLLDDVATAIYDLEPSMNGTPTLYGQPGYLAYRFAKNQALHRWRQRYRTEQLLAQHLVGQRDSAYEGLSDEWRPPKGSQKHRRATRARSHVKSADRALAELDATAVNVPIPPLELIFPELPAMSPGWDPGEPLVELRNPRVGQVEAPRVDLPGTRVAIGPSGRLLVTGGNGAGKSSLLAALAGTLPLNRGTRRLMPGVRVGYLRQDGTQFGEISGFAAYAQEALRLLHKGELDPDCLVPIAHCGLLTEEDLERPLRELSAGGRRRFELGCALLATPQLLILDEPTNHLSIDLVDALSLALQVTPAAVVIATHDRRMRADFAQWPVLELHG